MTPARGSVLAQKSLWPRLVAPYIFSIMSDVIDRLARELEGRYRVIRELGRGGMAVVALAEDLKHHRRVAIKVLKPDVAHSLGAKRFLREIEIAANLSHPNILPLHDSGEANGLLYFVMPYVDGDTLRDRLEREGLMPLKEAVRITCEVGDALDYAHAQGLMHRDIKPENILFQAGHAVVADFGIARAITKAGGTSLTETGLAVGTLTYMSPEQASGDSEIDARTDIYSLGCVLFEMLAGRPPHWGSSPQAILAQKLVGSVPDFRSVPADVPATVKHVVGTALAVEPAGRFDTPAQLTQALEVAVTARAIEEELGQRRRAQRVRLIAGAAGVTLVAGLAWTLSNMLGGPAMERLAVLPLFSTNDSTQDFFVAGLHLDLIQELSRAGVRVIGPTSVRQYRNSNKSAREIAGELGVDGLIEGTLLLTGDHVEIDLRLTDGATEELLWFGSYRAELRSVLSLINDVTRAIVNEIDLDLSPASEARLAAAPDVDPQVFEALLQARFHEQKLSREGLKTALDYYELVLDRDPDNAEAHAGIASVWGGRAQMGFVSAAEAAPRRAAAMARAMEIDSTLAAVQSMLWGSRVWGDWDWVGGEAAFRRVLAANPTDSQSRAYYSHLLLYLGRDDEAAAEIARAAEGDPFNPQIQTIYGMTLNSMRRWGEAESVLLETLSRTPDYGMALTSLRTTYHLMGRHDEALDIWRASNAGDAEILAALDDGNAAGGATPGRFGP